MARSLSPCLVRSVLSLFPWHIPRRFQDFLFSLNFPIENSLMLPRERLIILKSFVPCVSDALRCKELWMEGSAERA